MWVFFFLQSNSPVNTAFYNSNYFFSPSTVFLHFDLQGKLEISMLPRGAIYSQKFYNSV